MSLIEEARAIKEESRKVADKQAEADRLFQVMRGECEELLRGGELVKDWPRRVAVTVIFPFMLPIALLERIWPYDLFDKRRLQRSVNGHGELIKVTLISEFANSHRSNGINLSVDGLPTCLNLMKEYGAIYTVGSIGSRPDFSGNVIRRAHLTDAQQYREVLDLLK